MVRVPVMLSASRKTVMIKSSVGKTLNESAFSVYSVTSRITSASVMLVDSSRSSIHGGTGTIISTMSMTEAAATQAWVVEASRSSSPGRAGAAVATRSRSSRL